MYIYTVTYTDRPEERIACPTKAAAISHARSCLDPEGSIEAEVYRETIGPLNRATVCAVYEGEGYCLDSQLVGIYRLDLETGRITVKTTPEPRLSDKPLGSHSWPSKVELDELGLTE